MTAESALTIDGRNDGYAPHAWRFGEDLPTATLQDVTFGCQDIALLSSTRVVSAHEGTLALWSLPDGALLAQVGTLRLFSVRAVPMRQGENLRFVVGGEDGYLALWEVRLA